MTKSRSKLSAILAPAARQDIRQILRWSEDKFGKAAALRYEILLIQAIRDLEADPARPGARERPELPQGIITYHLIFSRDRVQGDRVKEPRHLLAYRVSGSHLEIVRILHDSRDLVRHLPPGDQA